MIKFINKYLILIEFPHNLIDKHKNQKKIIDKQKLEEK